MRAVVLVGGEGTRLRPLTSTTPKPLLPVANQPFLERQLEWLASGGVDEVVLSLGYLPRAFEEHFTAGSYAGMKLCYAVEDEPLGTAGATRFAAGDASERVLVCNGDILTTLDLPALLAFHAQHGGEATIALTEVDDPSAYGVVPTRADGEVVAFVEKPAREAAPSTWINAGTYVLEPAVLERIPPRLAVSIERETFPRMLESPGRLYAMRSDAYWLDIGTPQTYLAAHADVVAGRLGWPPTPGTVELRPGVWGPASPGVEIEAVLGPNVLVGPGVTLGAGAQVCDSVVGAGCRIEAGARILRSVLHDGVVIGAGAVVADSIVGARASVEAGARVTDVSVVAAGATVGARTQLSGARVPAR